MLIKFIKILNLSNQTLEQDLLSIFNVDMFLRTLVMEVATGNWGGTWNGNNYYLYLNPDTGKFEYFRHDLDLSFGMFNGNKFSGDWTTKNVYTWGNGGRGQ